MNSVFPDWLNANSGRAYPLSESGSLTDTTGGIKIPNSLIVAAQINMLPSYAEGTFFIRSIEASLTLVGITVGYVTGATERNVATVSVPVSTHSENTTYPFVGAGDDSTVLGSITIGRLEDTIASVPGAIFFSPLATSFEVSALFVSSPALEAVEIYNGSSLFKRFESILKLRAGENLRISYVDGDVNTIRIDAISGENLVKPSDCENATPLPECIRTINGQSADEDGNFEIDGGKCIELKTEPGLITLKDMCSQSCCGCTELEALLSSLSQVESQILQLRSQISTTVTQQNLMITNLVSNLQ
jgi:hypothetical protein